MDSSSQSSPTRGSSAPASILTRFDLQIEKDRSEQSTVWWSREDLVDIDKLAPVGKWGRRLQKANLYTLHKNTLLRGSYYSMSPLSPKCDEPFYLLYPHPPQLVVLLASGPKRGRVRLGRKMVDFQDRGCDQVSSFCVCKSGDLSSLCICVLH